MSSSTPKRVTVRKAIAILGELGIEMSVNTVHRHILHGVLGSDGVRRKLPAWRAGNRFYILPEHLEAFYARQAQTPDGDGPEVESIPVSSGYQAARLELEKAGV
jgi:hypothetical protein